MVLVILHDSASYTTIYLIKFIYINVSIYIYSIMYSLFFLKW